MEEFGHKDKKILESVMYQLFLFVEKSEIKYPIKTVGYKTPTIASKILADWEMGIFGLISPKPTVHSVM